MKTNMITVTHPFGVETDWVQEMAMGLGGSVEGNYTVVPPEVHTGIRYVLPVSEDITVLLADVTYHQDVHFKLRNIRSDFSGIYFNLTEGDSVHVMDDISRPIGKWNYNLAIVDGQLDLDYLIRAGSKSYNISIFVRKHILRTYLEKAGILEGVLDRIFDEQQNTIIHYDQMSSNSWHIINEFRECEVGSISFDLFLSSTVYRLLSDYLDHLMSREIIIGKVMPEDISRIIASQSIMDSQLEGIFPGIAELSAAAYMSETKYKKMYKKVTGFTPYSFFMTNKLELAKKLLASGSYTIGEVADRLSFANPSHFTEMFKNQFGMLPKAYLSLL